MNYPPRCPEEVAALVLKRIREKEKAAEEIRKEKEKEEASADLPPPIPSYRPPACNPGHTLMQLYMHPCQWCETFCNCGYTYLPEYFPDILVRSVDKKIVQLTGDMVRACATLNFTVKAILQDNEKSPLQEEQVIMEREPNVYCEVKSYKILEDQKPGPSPSLATCKDVAVKSKEDKTPASIRNTARNFNAYKRNKLLECKLDTPACPWDELMEIATDRNKVLVLFNPNTDQPTLGIDAETLTKMNRYISLHLDEVDRKLESAKCYEYWRSRSKYFNYKYTRWEPRLIDEDRCIQLSNKYHFEEWEEEFFDVDFGTLSRLHYANQELLCWDFWFALEKWTYLARGYPKRMVNGDYDKFADPEYDAKLGTFGCINVTEYPNIYWRGYRRRSCFKHPDEDKGPGYTPMWWMIKRE